MPGLKALAGMLHFVLAIALFAGALMSGAENLVSEQRSSSSTWADGSSESYQSDWESSDDSGWSWSSDSGSSDSGWSSSDNSGSSWDSGSSDSGSWDSWDSGSDSGSWDSDW